MNEQITEKYYRITAYYPADNFTFIADSNGKFAELWQFSAYLVKKGLKIIEVGRLVNMLDINISPAENDTLNVLLRACADGKPKYIEQEYNGILYKAIKVGDKIYIPNKEQK